MKLLKIIINFLKGNNNIQEKTNYKQKKYKYVRNKWGFISKEIDIRPKFDHKKSKEKQKGALRLLYAKYKIYLKCITRKKE